MNVPVRISPPIDVPSDEAVAEIRFSRMARKRAARALYDFSSGEPCSQKAMTDAAMRPRSSYAPCGLGRLITVRISTGFKVTRGISVTR